MRHGFVRTGPSSHAGSMVASGRFWEDPVPETLAGLDILAWFEIGWNEVHVVGREEPGWEESRRHLCFEVEHLQQMREVLEQPEHTP